MVCWRARRAVVVEVAVLSLLISFFVLAFATYHSSGRTPRTRGQSHAMLMCVMTRGGLDTFTRTSFGRVLRKVGSISSRGGGLVVC